MNSPETYYVGLATTFHDPALAVLNQKGEVLFAEAAERSMQFKHGVCCPADPRETVKQLLRTCCDPKGRFVIAKSWGGKSHQAMRLLNLIGVTKHEKLPRRKSAMTRYLADEDLLHVHCWRQHVGFELSGGYLAAILKTEFHNSRVHYKRFPHHLTHAANACCTSPFDAAGCAVVDGQGEFGSITYYDYKAGKLRELHRVKGPPSLGILYSACTALCGFDPEAGEEWKVMGLAPYGKLDPVMLGWFRELIQVDGLNLKLTNLRGINEWFQKMRKKARVIGSPALSVADLAYTTQFFYAEAMTQLLTSFYRLGVSDNLVFAGGCALNSSFNGEILERTPFKQLHIPSAPADDGNALGAAWLALLEEHPKAIPQPVVHSPYLGSTISDSTLASLARFSNLPGLRHLPGRIAQETARLLAQGKLVGWIQGRAEFGPRALGNRSILADPRPAGMKDKINSLVKFREEFRPFAPSILDEFGPEYFEHYQLSPYMDRTFKFKPSVQDKVKAIVHVNATGRVQSVRREWNPKYYDLIHAFWEITGIPMLLNTSFNIMGKPIAHSVEDALGLFFTTGLDALIIEDYLIEKSPGQAPSERSPNQSLAAPQDP